MCSKTELRQNKKTYKQTSIIMAVNSAEIRVTLNTMWQKRLKSVLLCARTLNGNVLVQPQQRVV